MSKVTKAERSELRERFEQPDSSDVRQFFGSGTLFDLLDDLDTHESTISEAIRWCELVSGSKSPGAETARWILGILKREKPKPKPIRFDALVTGDAPQTYVRFEDSTSDDPDLIDVVFCQGDKELHRVKDLTEAEILESFGIARGEKP
jgi:hypothetical protein